MRLHNLKQYTIWIESQKMSEINSQINQCDFQINKDLLTEIQIFKEILKVSKE